MQQLDLKKLSIEMLEYLLKKHGKAPLYWNFTREELEAELKRRGVSFSS